MNGPNDPERLARLAECLGEVAGDARFWRPGLGPATDRQYAHDLTRSLNRTLLCVEFWRDDVREYLEEHYEGGGG